VCVRLVSLIQESGSGALGESCAKGEKGELPDRGTSKKARSAAPAAALGPGSGSGQGQEGQGADAAVQPSAPNRSGTAVGAGVSSPEIVEHVVGFVAGGSRGARKDVGNAALVCRLWRDAAWGEEVWGRVVAEVLPVLGGQRDGRRYVMEMGRCIKEDYEEGMCNHLDWCADLRLHIEVWDPRDNLRMLSLEGPLGVCYRPEAPGSPEEIPALCVYTRNGAREVVGPAFSAASRGEDLDSIHDYFNEGVDWDCPKSRAVVRDSRSGRQARILEMEFSLEEGIPPDGRLELRVRSEYEILNPFSYTLAEASATVFAKPEPGQEGVPEREKLYRMEGGPADHGDVDHFAVHLVFKGFSDEAHLGLHILSKLHSFDRIP
jgi:hypothetical protein